jgi:hypothetical protein
MRAVKPRSRTPFSYGDRRSAIELWKAKVPLKTIREQLDMSKATLERISAFARANSENPVPVWKPGSGRPSKFSTATLDNMKRRLNVTPTLTGLHLKNIIELKTVSMRSIQRICRKTLKLPFMKMAKKPLLTERMRRQRLEFAMVHEV